MIVLALLNIVKGYLDHSFSHVLNHPPLFVSHSAFCFKSFTFLQEAIVQMAEMDTRESGSVYGVVRGPHNDEGMVCQFVHKTHSQGGVWYGGNMFSFTLPVMMLQFILMFFTTSMIGYLMRPFKQGMISVQLIVRP